MNSAGRNHGGERWRGKLPVPARAHPLVRRLVEEMNAQKTTRTELAKRSGLDRKTIVEWGYRSVPRIDNIIAAYNVLGLDLVVAPVKERG